MGTKGLNDHQTLDIYRLKLLHRHPDQRGRLYQLLAQLALQLGFAAEAAAVVQKGIDRQDSDRRSLQAPVGDGEGSGAAKAAPASACRCAEAPTMAMRWSSSARSTGVRAASPTR